MGDEYRNTGKNKASTAYDEPRGHRRHKKSLWRRLRHSIIKTVKTNKWVFPAIVISLVVIFATVLWMRGNIRSMSQQRVTSSNQHNVGMGYRNVTFKGREYRYNTRITSVLYIGVDSEGTMKKNETFVAAPRADSIQLIVMDGYKKKLSIIAINRNTICKIHRYSRHGYDLGEFKDQLCLAYAYGENGEISSKNVCNAVSKLLYGVPINDYVVCNRSSLLELCNVLGNVTVTVPNDDLVEYGYHKGDRLDIDSSNINLFVRTRDTGKDFSNVGRMQRQKAYINATIGTIMDMVKSDPKGTWEKIENAEYCMNTSITRNRYLDLSNLVSKASYTDGDYYVLDGKTIMGTFWEEFYPDEEMLLEKIIDTFYLPQ